MSAAWQYPRIIAHRLGGALAPENTLAGLVIAARLGVRAVEFDVMLSADGVPLVLHDETLERTTDGSGAVADTAAGSLAALDAGVRHHRAFAGERLPTFRAVLDRCHVLGMAANIEIKPATGHEDVTGEVVARTVSAFLAGLPAGTAPPLLFSSFDERALAAARAARPPAEVAFALLVETVPNDWQARMRALGCQALHCGVVGLTAARIAEICGAGVPLACYTVNRTAQAVDLFAAGVAAVFTDRIDLFDAAGEPWR